MKSGIPSGIPSHPLVIFGIPKLFLEYPMCAQATRLSDLKVKAAKPQEKDYVLSDGDGLQMRVRSNGSKLWNFNYRPTKHKAPASKDARGFFFGVLKASGRPSVRCCPIASTRGRRSVACFGAMTSRGPIPRSSAVDPNC